MASESLVGNQVLYYWQSGASLRMYHLSSCLPGVSFLPLKLKFKSSTTIEELFRLSKLHGFRQNFSRFVLRLD